jgi:hypothetical protein
MSRAMTADVINVHTASNGSGEVIIDCKIDNLYYTHLD